MNILDKLGFVVEDIIRGDASNEGDEKGYQSSFEDYR
jgi:hypothetical protein